MCAEVLELLTTEYMQSKRKRLTPRHIELGIRSDPELARYFKDKTFSMEVWFQKESTQDLP